MKTLLGLAASVLFFAGCASIPPEAPELSAQLGTRINALEAAHRRLLADFFNEKRRRVDDFVQQTWLPLFAKEFFSDPKIQSTWDQVVASKDPEDRSHFLALVGPKLQAKINAKRLELIQPLDQLENEISLKLAAEYDQIRSVNGTLNALLQSAAQADANRKRYLEAAGVTDEKVDSLIGEASDAVSLLLQTGQDVDAAVKLSDDYKANIQQIITNLRK